MSVKQKHILKPKVVVILGATATGKSDLAVKLAKKFNGEVVSADSRQVYKGLNIGSGKITKKEMCGVPHHLLDVVNPKRVYNASDYKKAASLVVRYIVQQGKIPIVCGGTGFYIDTLLGDVSLPEVPPNKKLRKSLAQKSNDELVAILALLDRNRSKNIDKHNRVRLIRAIEIASALGAVPDIQKEEKYQVLKIGLQLPDSVQRKKIETRLKERFKKGMIAEVAKLHKKGLSWKRLESFGLEYRYIAMYVQKKISKDEMVEKLNTEIWRYAKRQRRWFKRDKEIFWITPKHVKRAELLVRKFLKS